VSEAPRHLAADGISFSGLLVPRLTACTVVTAAGGFQLLCASLPPLCPFAMTSTRTVKPFVPPTYSNFGKTGLFQVYDKVRATRRSLEQPAESSGAT